MSPQRTYDSAFSDYTAGQWDLGDRGFRTFLNYFPRLNADDAQVNIGTRSTARGSSRKRSRISAGDLGLSEDRQRARGGYKLGLTYNQLKQPDLARKAFEAVMQGIPAPLEATLAKQALDRLGK